MTRFATLSISIVLVSYLNVTDAYPQERAVFESMSSGSSSTSTPEFGRAFEEAHAVSAEQRDALFTIERLLQRLLMEQDVVAALSGAGVDVEVLSSELDAYLQDLRKVEEGFATDTDPKMRRILQSTLMLWQVEGTRRLLSSLDVLAAIVRQGGSFAADRLLAYGFSAQEAADLADAHYAAMGREAEADLRRTEAKLAALSDQQSQQLQWVSRAAPTTANTPVASVADYRITVVSRDPINEVQFKGAVSASGSLTLLVETTPFEIEFPASEIIAVFESVNAREGISVELHAVQSDGTEKTVGGFGGASGAILKNERALSGLWKSGYLR